MIRSSSLLLATATALTLLVGCGDPEEETDNNDQPDQQQEEIEPFSDDCSTALEPGEDSAETTDMALDALIGAEPGDVVCFNAGEYQFRESLSLTVDDVEIRGEGRDDVILDFSEQDTGTNGLDIANVEDFEIRSLTVVDSLGDGIRIEGVDGAVVDDVAVDWTGEPEQDNGDYGIYPVKSQNVVVEHSVVSGSSDAGIYLGQSENGVIRHNEVFENVAGIEVENSTDVDVHDNEAHDNTGGILVFNLPELERKEGEKTRVFDNDVYDNNRENFAAEGAIVGAVPDGSAILVVSVQDVDIYDNELENHDSLGVAVINYDAMTQLPDIDDYDDPDFYPYPERVDIHSNVIVDSGDDPHEIATGVTLMDEIPEIIWDGSINDEVDEAERLNCFSGNVDDAGDAVEYANLAEDDDASPGPEIADDCEVDRDPLDPVDL